MEPLNELALFAGAGGGILGGLLCGFRTVCAVEWDAYARDVLVARQNDGSLHPFPIWDDIQTFDGRPWRGRVKVVSGGFPCQDISAAGKGAGITGERSGLWKHMARVIGEVLPQLVLVENSPMLVGRGLAVVVADLASLGYDARWGIVGAHHAGAPHKRDRIWIVANANGHHVGQIIGSNTSEVRSTNRETRQPESVGGEAAMADAMRERGKARPANSQGGQERNAGEPFNGSEDMADTYGLDDDRGGHGTSPVCREQGRKSPELSGSETIRHTNRERLEKREGQPNNNGKELKTTQRANWWATEPDLGRVAHGVACRVDRLRCLGNGQVPAVVPIAWAHLSNH